MYPLTVVRVARGHAVRVELKTGAVYEGILGRCDLWMNLHLKKALKNGTEKHQECYIKGSAIQQIHCAKKHMQMQEILQRKQGKGSKEATKPSLG